jgi:two-component sensor histidine kinase
VENLAEDERLSPLSRDVFRRLGHRTWCGVPITIGDRLLGTLNMWSRERFSPEDFAIATAFAAQAAVALENSRLYAEVQRELGERRRAEERLQGSVREKEVLLRELHHRVKNNMQIISSLLRLQSRQVQIPEVREIFRESQNRVRSMALVHEMLYQSKNLARVNLGAYFKAVAQGLYRTYGADPARILLKLEVAEIDVGVDVAIPCGLVVGELLSNALKHAFPSGRAGTLWVRAHRDDGDTLTVAVKDDGVGMPPGADRGASDSLGLRLVRMLTEDQLRGDVEFLGGTGTECRLRIPMETR